MATKQITDTNTVTTLENTHYIVAQKSGVAVDKISHQNYLAQIQSSGSSFKGYLSGGIEFNTDALPPTIKAGVYEINGIPYVISADYNLALSDVLGSCSRTLADYAYQWVFVGIRASDGAKIFFPGYDVSTPVFTPLGRTVTSIVVDGSGNAVCNTANTTGLVAADKHNGVVMGSSAGLISGQITAVVANTSFTIKVSNTAVPAGTYTGGTYDAYYRIYTQHNGPAGIIIDADVAKYTPSPPFCAALNCYGVDQYGRPTATAADVYARILGIQIIGAAGAAGEVVAYGEGSIKNDNQLILTKSNAAVTYGATNTKIPANLDIVRAWGSDRYLLTQKAGPAADDGMSIKFLKTDKKAIATCTWRNASTADVIGLTINDSAMTATMTSLHATHPSTHMHGGTASESISRPYKPAKDDILRIHTDAIAGNVSMYFDLVFIGD